MQRTKAARGTVTGILPRAAAAFVALLTCASAVASPQHALFLFELRGQPAGTVELSLSAGGLYRYTSRQLLQRASHRRQVERTQEARVGPGAPPWESLWLWQRPARSGCITVRAELTRDMVTACVTSLAPGDTVQGTLAGAAFTARYRKSPKDPLDALESLEVGESRFLRVAVSPAIQAVDLLGDGVVIQGDAGSGGALRLEPPLPPEAEPLGLTPVDRERAVRLAATVNASFPHQEPSDADFNDDSRADRGSCVGHVRRYLKQAQDLGFAAAAVFGVVAEDGRAYSHAWVRVRLTGSGWLDLDPTSRSPVTAQTHLPLESHRDPTPSPAVGAIWLDLLAGRRRLSR